MKAREANFDGLVGPTHNYSGLSYGNVASAKNQAAPSNPKQAAKQGLDKMKALADMGMLQGVLAPQERPDVHTLRRLGFTGSDKSIIEQAAKQAPKVLAACCSASSMWTANAATVSPSADTADGKIHFTPANLTNKFHRSIEHEVTGRILRSTFADPEYFSHHSALPAVEHFGDEGAANHTRFCNEYGEHGVEFFVFGRHAFDTRHPAPKVFPARHTFEACEAVARLHQLDPAKVVIAQQNPDVIDQGVFHNDVIAVGNKNILFCHQQAFLDQQGTYRSLKEKMGEGFNIIEVPTSAVSVDDAVTSYLFNSQLIETPNGETLLVLPEECRKNDNVWRYVEQLMADQRGIDQVKVYDLKQSMANGGGPACLRLRVVLNDQEVRAVNPSTLMNDGLYGRLNQWVDKHYRDQMVEADLADPQLLDESRAALDELTQILALGSVYPFQR
ncbi:N-succinylarginine dihydrolase [Photobacterium sp. WH77]|uniref:N-succinylarginine dihydrolase n=1 Tax=Photobacterium arenosum TaxID=2774143 RepID=A0ABR9BGJ1_9GAMM|nr:MULTISPECIES: N-succinylarginine dihydrolase [Photobacterium]MBD8511511.1 N-succinylarginine dihydrolase [Photobacterium arenosum]MBV7263859.1 N-succinylarginine dihydrolase [Photobacterium sp. WH24]MCG2837555.1 N-succinylarginine dihydrolase [Photobacterium sp. WH77]MCG2845171.1 N-succinylarginine dihydrolase [Photobacterium sp. WH80]